MIGLESEDEEDINTGKPTQQEERRRRIRKGQLARAAARDRERGEDRGEESDFYLGEPHSDFSCGCLSLSLNLFRAHEERA